MKKLHKIFFAPMVALMALSGCVPVNTLMEHPQKPLPEAYGSAQDTANYANIFWREYYGDPILVALIDTALYNNLDLLMAMQRVEMARSGVMASKGFGKPMVNALAAPNLRRFGLYTMDGAGNITTDILPNKIIPTNLPDFYIGFQSSWELDLWGKLRNKKQAAIERFLGTLEGRHWLETSLVAAVASSYYELLALDNALDIIQKSIQLQSDALEVIKIQKEAGVANQLAVQQFEGQLLNSKCMKIDVQQQILQVENRLNFLLGRYPQPVMRERIAFENAFSGLPQAGVPTALLSNRPDIRQAEFLLAASKADVKAAKAAFYPDVNLSATVGVQAFNPAFLLTMPQSLAYGLFGSLAAPLVNRAALKAEFHYANAAQLEAAYSYQLAILQGFIEVRNELSMLQGLEQLRDLKASEVEVLTQSIETSSDLFRSGRASYLEVILAQGNALQTSLELLETHRKLYEARINLYKALGGGWR